MTIESLAGSPGRRPAGSSGGSSARNEARPAPSAGLCVGVESDRRERLGREAIVTDCKVCGAKLEYDETAQRWADAEGVGCTSTVDHDPMTWSDYREAGPEVYLAKIRESMDVTEF
jgi:hypothetical protein